MSEIKKVLVCIDLSDYSRETIDYALMLLKGHDIEFIIVSVINIRDVNAANAVGLYHPELFNFEEYVEKEKTDRHNQILELMKNHLPSEMENVKVIVSVGHPSHDILKAIDKNDIDLVVIGNKGKGNLAMTALGSNAEKVFRHSPVPVVSVRRKEHFTRGRS